MKVGDVRDGGILSKQEWQQIRCSRVRKAREPC